MSSDEPTKPYVYQPFGSVTSDKARVEAGRLWGVGFPYSTHHGLAKVEGLTKAEAERVCAALGADPAQEPRE